MSPRAAADRPAARFDGRVQPCANAARAFEFHDDWSLSLQATRYQLEEVKRTSIERAFVRMVVTRGDKVAVQALYRLRSARQRIPREVARRRSEQHGSARSILSRCGSTTSRRRWNMTESSSLFRSPAIRPDEPVLVELRYTMPANRRRCNCRSFTTTRPCSRLIWLSGCRRNGSCSAFAGRGRGMQRRTGLNQRAAQ